MNLMLIMMMLSILLLYKYLKHFLMILMCMEFMVLTILYSIFNNLIIENMEFYYLIYMVFFVIESILGLSMLICMIHYSGNDYVKNMSLMMW